MGMTNGLDFLGIISGKQPLCYITGRKPVSFAIYNLSLVAPLLISAQKQSGVPSIQNHYLCCNN